MSNGRPTSGATPSVLRNPLVTHAVFAGSALSLGPTVRECTIEINGRDHGKRTRHRMNPR